ncbi:hypothetical protein [Acholeplasma palmae]|nr:hypothetical protein [Alteracholeplasma palmae]
MSLGTGFLVALIISSLNAAHRRKVRKKTEEINIIIFRYSKLKESYETMNDMLKKDVEKKDVFVTRFCVMNNSLNDFLKATKKITSLQTIDISIIKIKYIFL